MSSTTDAVQKFSGGVKQFGSALIADLAIITAKLANLAVTTAKIAALAVTTAKIAALAVTRAKMGDASLNFIYRTISVDTANGITEFLGLAGEAETGTESLAQRLVLRDGKLTRMKVKITTNILTVIATFVVNINGVPTTMTLDIPAMSTATATITTDVAISEDDLISIEVTTPAGAGLINAQVELEGGYNNA